MADITMCEGFECPLKNHCYRYTAPVNEFIGQAYFSKTPWGEPEMGKCIYYMRDTRDGCRITEGK
jgi:hypothetical protein